MLHDSPMFARPNLQLDERPDGSMVLRSREPLGSFPASLGASLARWARERADRPFLAERSSTGWRTVSYGETFEMCRRAASAFADMGLGRTTPIAVLSEASIAHAIVSLAALYAGIPVAPISPPYSTQFGDLRRLHQVLGVLQPALVFAENADVYRAALESIDPAVPLLVSRGSAPRKGVRRLDDVLAAPNVEGIDARHRDVGPNDVAKILFTSGSTGEPKGVINTHRMLCSNQQAIAQAWPFLRNHDLVLVDWLPWHHTFGGNHNFNMVLVNGGTLVIDDGRPIPGRFERSLGTLADHPPSVYFNVPRGHRMLVDALEADESFARRFFLRLRLIGNAAAALPPTIWAALRDLAVRYGSADVAVTGMWGMTETSPGVTAVHYPLQDSADVGLPLPGTDVLFVPYEHKLEVRVRGPQVTPGYWRRPDLTAGAFDGDGFYRTGDALRFHTPGDPSRGLLFDGRIAENFKLSSGTWVDAGAIRLAVLAAAGAIVDDVVAAGENGEEIGVLLFMGARASAAFADRNELRAAVTALLDAYNAASGGSSTRLGRAILVFEGLSLTEGELTDKGSVNQRRVLERRKDRVAELFSATSNPDVIVL